MWCDGDEVWAWDGPASLFTYRVRAGLWRQLIGEFLVPVRFTAPDLDRLLNSLATPVS
jgi:hypothetical protein